MSHNINTIQYQWKRNEILPYCISFFRVKIATQNMLYINGIQSGGRNEENDFAKRAQTLKHSNDSLI